MTVVIEPAMTVRDIATVLNVDEKTIYRLAQKGDLPGFKVSGSWRFQRPDLVAWIDAQKQDVKAIRSSQKGAL
jgi:excisionase family DNA binding protein